MLKPGAMAGSVPLDQARASGVFTGTHEALWSAARYPQTSRTDAAAALLELGHARGAGHRPVVLAVDGRSSSGKTTLAARLRDAVAGSAVVHTDGIA
jgi:hypothetical protein